MIGSLLPDYTINQMKLFFKAGFGDGIGLGHIKRCLNLANYLQSNFSITFLIINNNLKDENIIDKKKFYAKVLNQ